MPSGSCLMDRAEAVAKTVPIIKVTDEGMMMASCPICMEVVYSGLVHDLRMLLSAHLCMHPQDVELMWEMMPKPNKEAAGSRMPSFLFGVAVTVVAGAIAGWLF